MPRKPAPKHRTVIIRTIDDARKLLARAMERLQKGEIDPAQARAYSHLARAYSQVVDSRDGDEQLYALEKKISELEKISHD